MLETRPEKFGTLHFIGIGGIGMSGIAEALHALGYAVQGSDQQQSYNTKRLERRGMRVMIGHTAANLRTDTGMVAAVVVSSAVKAGNPELEEARRLRLPVVRRADMLAELMRFKKTVAVAGTHGKTTTTSMVAALLEEGEHDPTVINGGIIHAYGTNTRMGAGDWMVVESDESDGSFTRLPTTVAIVTNIDPEHMEHYGDFDAVRAAYKNFIENIPFYGFAVMCVDHPEVRSLAKQITDRRVITYGFSERADVRAVNMTPACDGSTFDVLFSGPLVSHEETVAGFFLPMMGQHNVQNALAALAVARALDMPAEAMKEALKKFQGVNRRFTKTGESNGITVIDDYGHHPVEIAAVLKAGRQALTGTGGKIIAVVQPHRYSRLHTLFDSFCTCLHEADSVIVADVYAAGEEPIEGMSKEALADGLIRHGHRDASVLPDPAQLAAMVAARAGTGDMVICLGAGSITTWAHALPEELDKIFSVTTAPAQFHG